MSEKFCSICGKVEGMPKLKDGICPTCQKCLTLHNMMTKLPKFEEVPELVDKLVYGIQTDQITGQALEDLKSFLVDAITKFLPK